MIGQSHVYVHTALEQLILLVGCYFSFCLTINYMSLLLMH